MVSEALTRILMAVVVHGCIVCLRTYLSSFTRALNVTWSPTPCRSVQRPTPQIGEACFAGQSDCIVGVYCRCSGRDMVDRDNTTRPPNEAGLGLVVSERTRAPPSLPLSTPPSILPTD